ncbi:hypothetical protein AOQ84DRAFT_360402 [Glonium stellatum]|uniref:Uncharacterized protein n=1 Tax=Glonium stellatum TaxID=574774 RepID=A0A8E2F8U5_9PEZI|nr:hypothetical protein AOQ84DRAFT_360402 [Glonium stellatum]
MPCHERPETHNGKLHQITETLRNEFTRRDDKLHVYQSGEDVASQYGHILEKQPLRRATQNSQAEVFTGQTRSVNLQAEEIDLVSSLNIERQQSPTSTIDGDWLEISTCQWRHVMTKEEKKEHDNNLLEKYKKLLREISYPPCLISGQQRRMGRRLSPVENTAKKCPRRHKNPHPPPAPEEASARHSHTEVESLDKQTTEPTAIPGSLPKRTKKYTNMPKGKGKNKEAGRTKSSKVRPSGASPSVRPTTASKGTACHHGRYPGDCRNQSCASYSDLGVFIEGTLAIQCTLLVDTIWVC